MKYIAPLYFCFAVSFPCCTPFPSISHLFFPPGFFQITRCLIFYSPSTSISHLLFQPYFLGKRDALFFTHPPPPYRICFSTPISLVSCLHIASAFPPTCTPKMAQTPRHSASMITLDTPTALLWLSHRVRHIAVDKNHTGHITRASNITSTISTASHTAQPSRLVHRTRHTSRASKITRPYHPRLSGSKNIRESTPKINGPGWALPAWISHHTMDAFQRETWAPLHSTPGLAFSDGRWHRVDLKVMITALIHRQIIMSLFGINHKYIFENARNIRSTVHWECQFLE